jgi:hypothetical protein
MLKDVDYSVVFKALHEKRRFRLPNWPSGEFIFLVPASTFAVNREPLLSVLGEGTTIHYAEHIDRYFGDGHVGTYHVKDVEWLADDWEEV